jgi:hypothetical protein
VTVPDTKVAREAAELVRDRTSDLIYHHSRRVYWWGSVQGRTRGLSFDPDHHPPAAARQRLKP